MTTNSLIWEAIVESAIESTKNYIFKNADEFDDPIEEYKYQLSKATGIPRSLLFNED